MQLFIWPQIFRVTYDHTVPVSEMTCMLIHASEGRQIISALLMAELQTKVH